MMKKMLAVSGGIDSMVMLDAFRNDPDVIVAHFNHGTRKSAKADEEFVRETAERLDKRFLVGYGLLGENVSEAKARRARYDFLRKAAKKENAEIFTAHHADDLFESMAINLVRGTGWRGIAPFGNQEVRRPFIETDLLDVNTFSVIDEQDFLVVGKKEIYRYAAARGVVYREDPTNAEEKYLRNRIRPKVLELSEEQRMALMKIYHETNSIKNEIDAILEMYLPEDGVFERELFRNMPTEVSQEILRCALLEKGITTTRVQRADFIKAIREYPAGKSFNLPKGKMIQMGKMSFRI